MTITLDIEQASREEALRAAYAAVPGLSRRYSFQAAMNYQPIRRCLEIMADIKQKKNRRRA